MEWLVYHRFIKFDFVYRHEFIILNLQISQFDSMIISIPEFYIFTR